MALERYTDLYDFAPVGYLSMDAVGVVREANLMSATLLGTERSQLVNRRLLLFVAPVSRPNFSEFLKNVFTEAIPQTCDALLLQPGGGEFWAAFRATPAVSLLGRPEWCRVAFGDITARKQAEELRTQLAAIVDSSEDSILSKDMNGVITTWNASAERLYGYTAQEAIGRPAAMLIPANRREEELERLGRHRNGERVAHFETIRRHKSGKRLHVSLTISPIRDSHGRIVGASKIAHDISDRRRAAAAHQRNEVLAASNQKLVEEIARRVAGEKSLKESRQRLGKLLSRSRAMQLEMRLLSRKTLLAQEEERKRISRELHDEIAQTLVGINVHLATLTSAETTNPGSLRQKIGRTQRLVAQAVNIVHRFAWELRPTALDDLGLVPALHAFMKEFGKRTGLHLRLRSFAEVEQLSMAKRTVLYRVAHEALTNVAHHARASRVEVRIERRPSAVYMKIEDDGKAFDVERVLHARGNQRMGLLGMRERLEMVGGTFSITSTPGQGTTIHAQVPVRPVRAARRGKR